MIDQGIHSGFVKQKEGRQAQVEIMRAYGLVSAPDPEFAEFHRNYIRNKRTNAPNLGRVVGGVSLQEGMVRQYRRRLKEALRKLRGEA